MADQPNCCEYTDWMTLSGVLGQKIVNTQPTSLIQAPFLKKRARFMMKAKAYAS